MLVCQVIVERRKRGTDLNVVRESVMNLILEIHACNGRRAEYVVHVIAKNLLAMCDSKGNQDLLLRHISNHKKEDIALSKDASFVWVRGINYPKRIASGWYFCIEWKDGTTSWEPSEMNLTQLNWQRMQ
jgi:hypothetical protein